MTQITATDFKLNFGHYLALAQGEDVYITKSGMKVAKLVGVKPKKVDDIESLFGLLAGSGELDAKSVKDERLAGKYESLD